MITYITGGQRSGKSAYAERLALTRSNNPVYLATARIWDDEFARRVEAHRKRRGPEWYSIEEPLHVGNVTLESASTVLLDCVTLLTTNWFFECGEDVDSSFEMIKKELDMLFSRGCNVIAVSNEIGMGGISDNVMQRKFTDLLGSVNQYVASVADEVFLVVSGIAVPLRKGI